MAEPKKRLSATRSGNRRSHLALKQPMASNCSHCKAVVLPHTVCQACGYYKDKPVLAQKNSIK